MGMSRAEILKQVANSSASGGGNHLRDGRGRLAIKSLLISDGFNGSRFVISAVVVGSQKIHVVQLKPPNAVLDIEPNAPGSDVSIVQMLDKHASSFGNVKAFMLGLYGMAEHEVEDADFIDTLDEVTRDNTARGMLIDYDTYRKVTGKGVEIVLPNWAHVEQDAKEIARTRAWMDSLVLGQKAAIAGSVGATATA